LHETESMLADDGSLGDLITAGARILECVCGYCVGVGQAPPSQGIFLPTSNRNFLGRSGTADAEVYLATPETAATSAIAGSLVSPTTLGEPLAVEPPASYPVDDSMILLPPVDGGHVEVRRVPNIKPLPTRSELEETIQGEVFIRGDNITTDHIAPAGAKYLPLRSNIPAMAEFVFQPIDPGFAK